MNDSNAPQSAEQSFLNGVALDAAALFLCVMNAVINAQLILPKPLVWYIQATQVLIAILYVSVSLLFWSRNPRRAATVRRILFFILIGTVLVSVFSVMYVQHNTGNLEIHDGALQTQDAVTMLEQKQNPYAASFTKGLMAEHAYFVHIDNGDPIRNPALEHFIYLPGILAFGEISHWIVRPLLGFEDLRFLLIAMYVVMTLLLVFMVWKRTDSLLLPICFSLNPFLIYMLFEGRNDILFLGLCLLSIVAMAKRQHIIAGILFGCTLAVKQFAWVFLPFIILYYVAAVRRKNLTWMQGLLFVCAAVCMSAACILPFFFWDAHAFIDDALLYALGIAQQGNYPISGFGFSSLFAASGNQGFPFWILSGISGITVCVLYGIRIFRHGRLSDAVVGATVCMAFILFFSRFLNNNYLLLISQLVIISFAFLVWQQPPYLKERRILPEERR